MKMICIKCKREFDEVEFSQFKAFLTRIYGEIFAEWFMQKRLCEACGHKELREVN